MSGRKANVYFKNRLAGQLHETDCGFVFQYDPVYLANGKPISLTLPVRAEPYVSEKLPSFFEGLLPEGWYEEIVSKVLKVDPVDRFGMLLATCRDCVGAASIEPAE
ncbi:MAG: phosphatidylinositol kinase [Phycisphaerae bacterium]|nr:phosphatidylinositol kinase [Phycisphaerae bacterium]